MDILSLAPGLLTVLGVWTLAVLLPGPNFLATAHTAMAHSRRAGLACAMGVAFGTLLWAAGSLAGLGLLFRSASWLYQGVKYAGAAYLVYMGLSTLWSEWRGRSANATARDATRTQVRTAPPADAAPAPGPASAAAPARRTPRSGWRAFRHGLAVDLANPKAAAFFTSLFAMAVPPEAPLWFQGAVVLTVTVIGGAWYSFVACVAGAGPVAAFLDRAQRAVRAVTGAIFVALGLELALEK
ncbi:MAG: LysE family translocator [Desulfovibrionaceae bacterium]|jgi:threonine/homoserine/homoserine lactone efflux protein|nr:LysE family translocator [Desulfovibrionaceae bacterium]